MKSLVKIASVIIVLAVCWFSISQLRSTQNTTTDIYAGSGVNYTPSKMPVYTGGNGNTASRSSSSVDLFHRQVGNASVVGTEQNAGIVFGGYGFTQSSTTVQSSGAAGGFGAASSYGVRSSGGNGSGASYSGIALAINSRPAGTLAGDEPFGKGGDINLLSPVNPPGEPFTPIPDGLWILLLAAAGYFLIIKRKGL